MKDDMFLLLIAALCAISLHFFADPVAQSAVGLSVPILIAAAYIVRAIDRRNRRG